MKKYFYLLILSILFFAQSSCGISPYPAVSSIPISQKETASGVAPLTSSSKVVQNSANPLATPAASKIPIADANGKLDGGISTGGSWVEANSYVSINAAVAAIGSTPTTLIVSSARLLTASLTIPQTLTLKILEGGSIVQASTYTLTINGPFEGGLCRVFSGFSPGGVVFGNASVKEISPIWFGAYADGTHATATTSAINQAASAGRTYAIPIRFSGNSYAVNDSLNFTISGKEGWRVKGDGPNTTVITGTLTGAYPVFDCAGSQSMQVEDLRILGGATGSQSCGLLIARSPDAPFGNRGDCCSIKRVQIDGTFSKAGLANSSADQSVLDGCYIVGPVGVVISPTDYLGVGSEYVSLSPTSTGCTYNVIRDCIGIIGTARACVLFNDGAALNCYGTYFAAYAGNQSYFELTGANFKSVKLYGCRGENSGSNDPLYILNMTGGATSQGGFLEGEFDSSANGAIIHGQITSYFVNIYLHSLLGSLVQGTAAYSVLYNVQNLPSTLTKSVQNIVMGGGSQRTEWMAGNNLFFCGDNNLYEGSVVTWRKLGLGAGKTAKAPTGSYL